MSDTGTEPPEVPLRYCDPAEGRPLPRKVTPAPLQINQAPWLAARLPILAAGYPELNALALKAHVHLLSQCLERELEREQEMGAKSLMVKKREPQEKSSCPKRSPGHVL